jgi:hypothetical protein
MSTRSVWCLNSPGFQHENGHISPLKSGLDKQQRPDVADGVKPRLYAAAMNLEKSVETGLNC